ncbi:MAG: hypothetical protein CMJ78_12485 [Planctomycetaceae bacterium]|nr:hypothetical protein [Planctomycetaceae bacterium]
MLFLSGCGTEEDLDPEISVQEGSEKPSGESSGGQDQSTPPSKVTPAELIAAGERTSKSLPDGSYRWVARHELKAAHAEVEILRTPVMRRISIDFILGQNRSTLITIIERDGFWYCTQQKSNTKYKPYEAVLELPIFYHLLARSEINVVTEANAEQLKGATSEVDDDVVTLLTPLPDAMRRQLEGLIAGVSQLPPDKIPPQQKAQIAQMEQMLERGFEMKVERSSGIVLQAGMVGKRTWIIDFEDVEQPDPASFSVSDQEWEDHSAPISTKEMADVMMISHAKSWRPGMPKQDMDVYLLNINSGEMRRVPFQLGLATMGCFSPKRNTVFISGHVQDGGYVGLFEIDLNNGDHRQLGGEMLQTGVALGPTLSPDGKTLAICRVETGQDIISSQVVLIDVKTGDAKPIGERLEISHLNWLPDASGLVIESSESVDPTKPSKSTICRMDLDGTITAIRKGDRPLLVNAPEPAILFYQETEQGNVVMLCDLDGKNERQLADGLKRHGFGTVSPDGKRIAMMKFTEKEGPRPVIIDLATGKSTTIAVGAGLWSLPRWK